MGARDAARLLGAGRLRGARSRCATASASAGRSSRARCAPRTWPRSTRSTRRAGAPTRCARCCRARCRRSEFTGRRLYEVLDLCLECKALQGRVPGQRRHGQDEVRVPRTTTTRPTGCRCATGSSAASTGWPGSARRWRRSRTGSRARRRTAGCSSAWPASTGGARCPRSRPSPSPTGSAAGGRRATGARGEVVLFHDTFITYQTPGGRPCAATRLLEAARLPRGARRPRVLRAADDLQGHAGRGARRWRPTTSRGSPARRARARPIVGLEPSCLLTLRDEYPELVRTEDARLGGASRACSSRSSCQREWARGETPPFAGRTAATALLHGHCHQKAMVGTAPDGGGAEGGRATQVTEVDAGCCGMAGSFGFEARALRPVGQDRRAAPRAGRARRRAPTSPSARRASRAASRWSTRRGACRSTRRSSSGRRSPARRPRRRRPSSRPCAATRSRGAGGGRRHPRRSADPQASLRPLRAAPPAAGGAGRHATPSAPSARARPGAP